MRLWMALRGLATGVGADRFAWKWITDGSFLSKMAYRAFFFGCTALPGAAQVWHSFTPFKVKFHAWLALRRRCWTADRLAKRGLPTHTLCKLCHVSAKTLDHLSLQCPYATVVWSGTWQRLGLAIPLSDVQSNLEEWWPAAVEHLSRDDSMRANSLIMLALRSLWLERNARVFDNVHSPAVAVVNLVVQEWGLWLGCKRRDGSPGDVT
jgi:hypothetical protein